MMTTNEARDMRIAISDSREEVLAKIDAVAAKIPAKDRAAFREFARNVWYPEGRQALRSGRASWVFAIADVEGRLTTQRTVSIAKKYGHFVAVLLGFTGATYIPNRYVRMKTNCHHTGAMLRLDRGAQA